MREVFLMWRESRMIVLTVVVTAVYTAVLIPFKGFALVPGFTEIRPANGLPVAFSIMFGPAAAWGSAFGNLLADIFGGTLTRGSIFGFVGNFFFGLAGYKLWGNLGPLSCDEEPTMRAKNHLLEFAAVAVVASMGTAAIIAWGLDTLGLVPFSVLGAIIAFNNLLASVILGPIVLYVLYPLVKRDGLLYPDMMVEENLPPTNDFRQRLAGFVVASVAVCWWLLGIAISLVVQGAVAGADADAVDPSSGMASRVQLVLGSIAFVALLVAIAFAGERLSSWLEN